MDNNIFEYNGDDTIFVQISSYRDPELQHTLQDLFKKAKRPENIFVGICHQYDMNDGTDKHLFEVPFPRPNQLRIYEIDYRETSKLGLGLCLSRNQSQKLYNGEAWFLAIDSHTRFVEDWDQIIVNDIKSLKQPAVIGNVPPNYCHKTNIIQYRSSELASGIFFNNPEFRCTIGAYSPVPSIRAGAAFYYPFVMGNGKIMSKAIIDPELMWHDEFPMFLRLFTHGANIFYYNKTIVAHLYRSNDEEKELVIARSNTYKTTPLADEIVLNLTNVKKSNNQFVIDRAKKYGMGDKRTIRDYERYSGVNVRRKKLREHTKVVIFENWQNVVGIKEIKGIFKNQKK